MTLNIDTVLSSSAAANTQKWPDFDAQAQSVAGLARLVDKNYICRKNRN